MEVVALTNILVKTLDNEHEDIMITYLRDFVVSYSKHLSYIYEVDFENSVSVFDKPEYKDIDILFSRHTSNEETITYKFLFKSEEDRSLFIIGKPNEL